MVQFEKTILSHPQAGMGRASALCETRGFKGNIFKCIQEHLESTALEATCLITILDPLYTLLIVCFLLKCRDLMSSIHYF